MTAAPRSTPITVGELAAVVGIIPDDLRGRRDRALLLLAFAGGLRRAEIAGLRVGNLSWQSDGSVNISLPRRTVRVSPGRRRQTCPVRALHGWLDVSGLGQPGDPVFGPISWSGRRSLNRPLTPTAVGQLVAARFAAAGLPGLTAGSLPAGRAAALAGAPLGL